MRWLAVILAMSGLAAATEVWRAGPQVVTYFSRVDDTDQPYALYVPPAYDPQTAYPLVISLHGRGSDHRHNLRQVLGKASLSGETEVAASRYFPAFPEVNFLVAAPLARGAVGYEGIGERDVYDVLDDVKRRFRVDEERIYLTGVGSGGGGALRLAVTRPDLWAAVAVVSPDVPEEVGELAGNALHIPVKFFQGRLDPLVRPAQTKFWVELLQSSGAQAEYVEFPGVRHNAWERAYRDAAIFEWFSRFRRERHPDRVVYRTRRYKYSSAYWVRLDGFTPGVLARVEARFVGPGEIVVKTENVDGFTLNLTGHPGAVKTMRVEINGARLKIQRGPLSFRREAAGWKQQVWVPERGEKGRGREGPLAEALADRHIYVYGTGGGASPAEVARRRTEAAKAAEWSGRNLPVMASFRVLADEEVGAEELQSSNLVLFGNAETNSVIRRLGSSLPIALHSGAADYGLLYIYPVGQRYVVINSGLPWWTRVEMLLPRLPLGAPPWMMLRRFGDFVLYRGGIDQIIVEGSFDRWWGIPVEARVKMEATGAVTVR